MRKAILACLVVLPCTFVLAQSKNGIGLYTSLLNAGSNFVFSSRTGTTNIKIENGVLIGAEYNRGLNNWLKVNIGIEYSHYPAHENYIAAPGMLVETDGYIQHVTVPLYLRADIGKYFFFTFGVFAHLQTKTDLHYKNSELGITGGTGFKFDFQNKMTVFVHPFYQLHGALPDSHSLYTVGFRSGISYRF